MKKTLQKRLVLAHDTLRNLAELPRARLQDVAGGFACDGNPTEYPACASSTVNTASGPTCHYRSCSR
jgi:hypothetical protein